jgi:predicted dinucleotide-binding enzyme
MTVAIIGSGKMGSGFARLLASKGFDIAIGNKNPEKAVALAREIGAGVKGGSERDAVEFEPIDSGTLYNSRFLEPMGEMNILLGFFLGWGTSGAPEYRNS